MKKIISTIIILSFYSFLFSQNTSFTKASFPEKGKELKAALKNIKKGSKAFDKEADYRNAAFYFLKANEFNPNNAELNYKIFLCYNHLRKKEEGFTYLDKAFNLDSNLNADITFYRGTMHHYYCNFDTAIYYYTIASTMREQAVKHIKECNTGKQLLENEVRCFIDNVGENINSKADDYNPIITADGKTMYFTSRREGKGIKLAYDGRYFENIYTSTKDENNQWTKATLVSELSASEVHSAVQGLSNDGQKIIIYRGDNNGDLFESEKRKGKFSKPKSIKEVNKNGRHEASASYSFDNKTLYFCSDRKNADDKHDIYKITKNMKDKWENIEILSNVINTNEDERTIFAHPDGKTIYFSSNGHDGMGGYDIYSSTFENGNWTKPVNLGYPINTPGDDVYFVITADGKYGYYSSDKAGGYGGNDIYMITFLGPEKLFVYNTEDNLLANTGKSFLHTKSIKSIELEPPKLTLLKGKVIDEDTKEPLFSNIELYDLNTDELLATFESDEETGRFLLSLPSGKNYSVNVKAEGYLFLSQNFNLPDSASYQEIEQTIELKKLVVGKEIVLNNIFFEFNKATLLKESKIELDNVYKLLTDNPNIHVEISGHTDNVGSANYNKKLSQERANSVVNYLIEKGITKDRLTASGYGFDKPIAPNTTEEGRQKNRRTEFKIVK